MYLWYSKSAFICLTNVNGINSANLQKYVLMYFMFDYIVAFRHSKFNSLLL